MIINNQDNQYAEKTNFQAVYVILFSFQVQIL